MSVDNLFSEEELQALKEGTPISGAISSNGSKLSSSVTASGAGWGAGPRISKTRMVSGPSAIRTSHEGGELIELRPVAGPSVESINAGQAKEDAERKALAKAAVEQLEAIEATEPEKVQARLAFLEREVKKLTKQIKEVSNG